MRLTTTLITAVFALFIGIVGCQYAPSGFDMGMQAAISSPKSFIANLDKAENALNEIYEDLDSIEPEEAVKRGMIQLDRLNSNYEALGNFKLETEQEREAQMCVLRSYYLVQSIMPKFTEAFQCQANRVIELRPDSDDAAVARVLLFCSRQKLTDTVEIATLRDIATEAHSYESNKRGVGLYSVVAHEFWKNGNKESAEKVLETGIAHYKKCPEKMALVNQMIDQGHREPPEPKLTQSQFKRMERALANSQPSAGIQFRS